MCQRWHEMCYKTAAMAVVAGFCSYISPAAKVSLAEFWCHPVVSAPSPSTRPCGLHGQGPNPLPQSDAETPAVTPEAHSGSWHAHTQKKTKYCIIITPAVKQLMTAHSGRVWGKGPMQSVLKRYCQSTIVGGASVRHTDRQLDLRKG